MDQNIEQPTIWDHITFWLKEIFILAILISTITFCLSAFFSLPEVTSKPELLEFILS
jgi:hypothetical protein